ncbi:hypothetical protein M409DRAFT_26944 [Zasmidium cellare ATCC 36951]|uniref:Heterokaryon incompatibility domain-containing protein n=1 Tax=Zasmidium cellare ATCC 36951 TaxID=1080233 RepID=A0A6A6C6A2_ZASCE|nr:uncharacterized protein M409DRAFT_26944 [Zasmidium cellare ATCC 36951]KAF2162707.1 hypothetical protein M409DRAFT_26944 [Zasmidium cellare ATCC 36951]
MSQEPFVHHPLEDARKQIRLLRFIDTDKEDIACELSNVDIAFSPPYAAISYTWASPQDPRRIEINGKDFNVWQNCHYALTQIAPHLQAGLKHFWLDSICINQNDLDEKALQVEMMADIYTRAETDMAAWIRLQPLEARYNQSLATDHMSELQSRRGTYDLEFGRKSTAAYIAFGNRENWQRMWIVQEARLAENCTLFCGPDSIDLADFATFLRAMMNDKAADTDIWLATWLLTDMWRVIAGSLHLPRKAKAGGNVRPLALSKALETFDQHKASNFRDHLYALAKVTEWPDGGPPPRPDYRATKLALLREVLQRLAKVNWAEHRCYKAIGRLLAAFDMTVHEPEMQALLRQQDQATQQKVADSTQGSHPLFLYAGEFLRRPAGCRIRRALDGSFTANIANSNRGRELFEEEKARIWTSRAGMPLYVDDEIAGYLCPQTEPEDVLLQIENGNGLPIWLVIRSKDTHEPEPSFTIIGPALANPGFAVQSTERTGYTDMYDHSGIPEAQRNMPSVFDLWFDQEEFLHRSTAKFLRRASIIAEDTPSAPCRLLALPRELRDIIYEYTFTSFERNIRKRLKREAKPTAGNCNASLVLTCKQIHAESIKAYYLHTIFASLFVSDLRQWIDKLPDPARKALKHVKMKRVAHCCSSRESIRASEERRIREAALRKLQDLGIPVEVQSVSMGEYLETLRAESIGRWI